MSHYPTSAELRDFRAGIWSAYQPPDSMMHIPFHPPADTPRRYTVGDGRFTDPLARPVSGAWGYELSHGIGYRAAEAHAPEYVRADPSEPWWGYHVVMSANDADRVYATRARREAAAMRSRAFSSVITEGQRAVYHGGSARNACLLERSEGLPVPLDHYHMSGAQLA